MVKSPTHHLMLTDTEVTRILCALEGYEPVYQHASKGEYEQLARRVQQSCGITLDPHEERTSTSAHRSHPNRSTAETDNIGG